MEEVPSTAGVKASIAGWNLGLLTSDFHAWVKNMWSV